MELSKYLIFLFLFISLSSKGSHSVGADITYKHISGNRYKITLSFYRDCSGIAAPTLPFVNIISNSCGMNTGVYLDPLPGTGQEIFPTCTTAVSTCAGGTFIGVQEWVYENDFVFPVNCTDWVISYSLCCRNAAITTIVTPGSNTFYVYSLLNNTITPKNNSPTFLYKPVPFQCINESFCYNNGTIDIDGDSIVYSLITPLQNSFTPVTYLPGYSYDQPLTSIPLMTFDSNTGNACVNPQSSEISVMAVLVEEYRNGILIGAVERDIQLIVTGCNCITLPIELLYFKGTNNKGSNIIKWATLSETNNDYFLLKRSNDGQMFSTIAKVDGKGNSTDINQYYYSDNTPMNDYNYYQLTQVDYDGRFSSSSIIVLNNKVEEKFLFLEIYDAVGKKVIILKDDNSALIKNNVEYLKLYFIHYYYSDGSAKIVKFIKF